VRREGEDGGGGMGGRGRGGEVRGGVIEFALRLQERGCNLFILYRL